MPCRHGLRFCTPSIGYFVVKSLRMSYMEMGSTHSSVEVKGVSPLEDEIWKRLLPTVWCGPGFDPGTRWTGMASSSLLGMGGSAIWWSQLLVESAGKTLVGLHLVLGTNRFSERSMFHIDCWSLSSVLIMVQAFESLRVSSSA
mgnify:FL=1